jgi:flagellar M-ring protein FliF
MQPLQVFITTLSQRFGALDMTKKVVVLTLLAAMAGSGLLLFNTTTDNYDVLYSNMAIPDASMAVSKLKELNVPFKLADNGTTILVPAERKNELVLETAGDLEDSQTVSLSKIPPVLQGEVQKEWLKKFNSDSVSEIIGSIQGIKHAKVMVAQPESTVFTDQKEAVRASVMLVVEPGFRLKEAQVKTIKNLVAHAVPGLNEKDVAISDNFGNSLEDPAANGGGLLGDADSKRKLFEDETSKKIKALLDPLVGADNAVVSVSAEFNFNQKRSRIHAIKPIIEGEDTASGLVVSQQKQLEEYDNGKKGSEGGAAGSESNVGASYQASADGDANGKNYRSSKEVTNYAHSEEDSEIIHASGTLERLNVAVVLNKVLTGEQTTELKAAITSAVGLKADRGDTVEVKGFEFSEPPSERNAAMNKAYEEAQFQEFLLQMAYLASMIVLGMTALFVFYNLMKRPAAVQAELMEAMEAEAAEQEAFENDALALLPDHGTPRYIQISTPQGIKQVAALPQLAQKIRPEVEEMRQAIYGTIQQDPEEAAKVLVAYMREGN